MHRTQAAIRTLQEHCRKIKHYLFVMALLFGGLRLWLLHLAIDPGKEPGEGRKDKGTKETQNSPETVSFVAFDRS